MRLFQSVKTLEDLKAEYLKQAKQLHPDTGSLPSLIHSLNTKG